MENIKAQKNKKGKQLSGVVVSLNMKDTAKVLVERYVKHPMYGKYVIKRKNYLAECKEGTCAVGDTVTIQETKPISKKKRHFVV